MTDRRNVVVVDTSVVSYLFNDSGPSGYYANQILGKNLVVSFQTLEEAQFGALKDNWGARRKSELERHLQQYDVIWPNPDLVAISAHLRRNREQAGRKLNTADAWIAATALLLECPLASHDGDFVGIPDLELIRAPF